MHLENYHYILEIERCKSISAAARALLLPQTTLSSAINAMERELGFSIFYRTPNGMVPTPKGESLLTLAREIDIKAEELRSLATREWTRAQPISFLITPGGATGAAGELARLYYRFALHGDLTFEEWPRLDITQHILQRSANLGLTFLTHKELTSASERLEAQGVNIMPMLTTRFYLMLRKDHPIAKRGHIVPEDYHNERFCFVTGCSASGQSILFASIAQSCRHLSSVTNFTILHSLIREENMVGIMTWYTHCAGGFYDPDELTTVPLPPELEPGNIFLCLVHRSIQQLRYQERILVSCVEEYFQGLFLPEAPDGASLYLTGRGGALS